MEKIYLASKSPRRRSLLAQLNVEFDVVNGDIDETPFVNEDPASHVKRLASAKAQAGWLNSPQDRAVLGSDTIVVWQNEILGKPKDQADAVRMLSLLSGQIHQVMTAVHIQFSDYALSELVISDVEFCEISETEILTYWQTGEPADKAGSYAIQGIAGQYVKKISGSYSAIVGLPLYETRNLLKQLTQLTTKRLHNQ